MHVKEKKDFCFWKRRREAISKSWAASEAREEGEKTSDHIGGRET